MKLEVLHVRDCPNLPPLLEQIAKVTDLPVTTRMVESDAEAAKFGMAGSPTLMIDGVDPFAAPDPRDRKISCRLYRDNDGRIVPVPTVDQLWDTIVAADPGSAAAEVLSAWRTRAVPLDRVEKAAHQAILRGFATTGRPPAAGDLNPRDRRHRPRVGGGAGLAARGRRDPPWVAEDVTSPNWIKVPSAGIRCWLWQWWSTCSNWRYGGRSRAGTYRL